MELTLGERLRIARLRRAWSQQDLAARSGVPQVTISRIENARYGPPRPGTIRKLSTALEIDPAWLLFGDAPEGKVAA